RRRGRVARLRLVRTPPGDRAAALLARRRRAAPVPRRGAVREAARATARVGAGGARRPLRRRGRPIRPRERDPEPGAHRVDRGGAGDGRAFGKIIQVSAVDRNVSKVIDVDWQAGSAAVPARLGANGAFTDDKYAKRHHLVLGSPVSLETPSGKTLSLRIAGIF